MCLQYARLKQRYENVRHASQFNLVSEYWPRKVPRNDDKIVAMKKIQKLRSKGVELAG